MSHFQDGMIVDLYLVTTFFSSELDARVEYDTCR